MRRPRASVRHLAIVLAVLAIVYLVAGIVAGFPLHAYFGTGTVVTVAVILTLWLDRRRARTARQVRKVIERARARTAWQVEYERKVTFKSVEKLISAQREDFGEILAHVSAAQRTAHATERRVSELTTQLRGELRRIKEIEGQINSKLIQLTSSADAVWLESEPISGQRDNTQIKVHGDREA